MKLDSGIDMTNRYDQSLLCLYQSIFLENGGREILSLFTETRAVQISLNSSKIIGSTSLYFSLFRSLSITFDVHRLFCCFWLLFIRSKCQSMGVNVLQLFRYTTTCYNTRSFTREWGICRHVF
jgi:hypothetical protein